MILCLLAWIGLKGNMEIEWNEWFVYSEMSPSKLLWKVDRVSGRYRNQVHVKAGDVAGCVNSSGYYQVKLHNKLRSCHIIILEMHGKLVPKGFVGDHENGNKLDNSLSNLRVIERCKNPRNNKMRVDNTSGVTGVTKINNGQGNYYWSARVENGDGTFTHKRFSLNKLGDKAAFKLAVVYREAMIAHLNEKGAGYTDRHGKFKGE